MRHRGPLRLAAFAFATGGAALVTPAAASPLFELAGAASGTGGLNARVTGAGAPSTYFNPALLPDARQSFVGGVLLLSDQISLTLDGRHGGRVPGVVGDRQIVDANGDPISNETVPTDWLERGCSISQCGEPPFGARPRQEAGSSGNTRTYGVIGLVTRLLEERFVLGFHALVPMTEFTAAHSFYNDEREQFFSNSLHPELYSDRMTATSLAFGAGSRFIDELSLGVSFTLNLTNQAAASTYVRDPIDYDKILVSTDVHVKASVSPHFGAAYDPLDWLHFAGAVHAEQKFTIETGVAASLPAGNESSTTRRAVHSFLPWTFGLGTRVDLNPGAPHAFSVVGGAKYALWSDYVDRQGGRPGDEGARFEWSDVLSGAVGVRHRAGALESFLDVGYQPSPVPDQVGRSNYVDNDRIGAMLGGDYGFLAFDVPLRAGITLEGHHLVHRYQKKDDSEIRDELPDDSVDSNTQEPVAGAAGLQTNNPGWPGFASEGFIFGGSVTLAIIY